MRTNKRATNTNKTHEGAPALPTAKPEAQLRRSIMACLLWEDQFYEDGKSIADRIAKSAMACSPTVVADIAVEARSVHNLRHAPLYLTRILSRMSRGNSLVSRTLEKVIQRPDEIPEFLSMYWKDGKQPISAQVKKGLSAAFNSFDAYQLAKYDRNTGVRLRDVAFLTHAKPTDKEKGRLLAKLLNKEYLPQRTKFAKFPVLETYGDETVGLESPDTWEVALSGGADKKETFERLIKEGKLGYLALIRNLRNMEQAGVDRKLVEEAIIARKGAHRVLPFRFFAAAREVPSFEKALDKALKESIKGADKFDGETLVLVDVSGSMEAPLSQRSKLNRMDAAATLGCLVDGDVRTFAFGTDVAEVPHRLGMAGIDAFKKANVGHGTNIGEAVTFATKKYPKADRVIVITDMQSHDAVNLKGGMKGYMINVASYQNAVGYGNWTHIDGFSSQTLKYINSIENS